MLRRLEYKWLVAIVFVFGLFMELLDMTITNVALPTLAQEFHANASGIEWIITGYLLSLAIFIPLSGWVGDRFGTKRTFMFALAVFTAASFLCSLSWSIGSLTAFRILQGVGGGMLTPVGTAMMFRAFPLHERARVSSLITIPAVVAPASGPVLGGYLVEHYSWHWIFLINIPIGLAAFVVAGLVLKEHREPSAGKLDVPGFIFGTFGLASVIYALSEAGSRGWGDTRVVSFGLAGLAALTAFVVVELRAERPMIDLRLFRYRLFTAGSTVLFFSNAGFGGVIFLLPLLLQAEKGMSPLESGLTTFPQAIGVMMMAPLAGKLYPRIGPRRLLLAGMTGTTLVVLAFRYVGLDTGDWTIRALMLVNGWMFALGLVPMQAAAFAEIRGAEAGHASAAFSVLRQVASSFGVALIATMLTSRLAAHGAMLGNPQTREAAVLAFQDSYLVAAVITGISIVATFLIKDKLAAGTMHRVPDPEAIDAEIEAEDALVGAH